MANKEWVFRDITPKDFYFIAYLDSEVGDMPEFEKSIRLLSLFLTTERQVEQLFVVPLKVFNALVKAVLNHILKDKMMTPNQWLELAFHLCKQRWDHSVEWLEGQPMSKVSLMIQIQADFGEKMKKENAKIKR